MAKKTECQINELSKQIDPYKAVIIGPNECFNSPKNYCNFYQKVSLFKSKLFVKNILLIKCFFLRKIIAENISNLTNDDIIYLRYPIFITSIPIILFSKKKRFKIIFEHNTIELDEFKLHNGKISLSYFHEFFFGYIIRNLSDAIVGVTEEITNYQLSNSKNKDKLNITIGNGIKVNSCKLRQIPEIKNETYDLLCIANFNRWHGIDRLIQGISNYKGNFKIILHLIGNGKEEKNLSELVNELKMSDSIIFHGFKSGTELDSLFDTCHIAVGSLGLHRIGLSESSTLKIREYCARGIPWIIACNDPDFPDDFPYILRVPPDESPIDIDPVIDFAQKICSDPDHPKKMRKYAEENLDWSIKMKKLKGFLESLIEDPSSSA